MVSELIRVFFVFSLSPSLSPPPPFPSASVLVLAIFLLVDYLQHRTLANKARRIPGVPLLYLHGNAINLEKASEESKKAAGVVAQERLVPQHETEKLPSLLEQEGLTPVDDSPLHKKKKLKGPNPLSVLKKKKGSLRESSLARRERRKWRRVRKLKEPPSGRLEEMMLTELALEAAWGDRGRVYLRKSVAQLKRELRTEL